MDVRGARAMSVELMAKGISNDVLSTLEAQGLPVRRKLDLDVSPFPRDITAVNDQELMLLARNYMENYNFMITQVACAELAITELENSIDLKEAKLLLALTGPKTKPTIIKAQIATDDEISELNENLLTSKAYYKLLKTMQDNLERYYQLTSRELTRRTSSMKSRF
jgi:hypothetical protein